MDGQRSSQGQTQQQTGRAAQGRIHRSLVALPLLAALLLTPVLAFLNVEAASGFAAPAFGTQWNAGEAVALNFWGPVGLAKDGQQEPYVETGGSRLVQYFDKARMEIDVGGTVTNGLLATELITGNRQLGDTAFQNFGAATISIAGDPDNVGPTYAAIQSNAAQLRVTVASTPGAPVTLALTPAGVLTTFATGASFGQANIGGFDDVTQHNVPTAFVTYRATAGIPAIGLAISEPFWSNVKVAGVQRDVLMQAFERRVLTYTPANPAAFQVEFGNIGSHYYTWRYVTNTSDGGGTVATPIPMPVPSSTAPTPTTAATATTTTTATRTATPTTAPAVAPVLSAVTIRGIRPDSADSTFTTNVAACGANEIRVKGNAEWISTQPGFTGFTCPLGMGDIGRSYLYFNLSPNTSYEVRGAAKVGMGPIGYSAIATFTTLSAMPTAASYVGMWNNDDMNTVGVTRLLISITGTTMTIIVYHKGAKGEILLDTTD